MRLTTVLFFCSLLLQLHVNGQSSTQPAKMSIVPPSPEAAAINKYIDMPVNTYTGIPSISIPLYEIKVGKLSIPIGLSYHAGGHKVEEVASWVGLGWTLSGAYQVSRSMVGLPDETPEGYMNAPAVLNYAPATSDTNHAKIVRYISGMEDAEPDIFYMSGLNVSGKFLLDKISKAPNFIPHQKIKLSYGLGEDGIQSWNMVGTDGTRYKFNVRDASVSVPFLERGAASTTANSAWWLSEIQVPESDKKITYEYQQAVFSYLQGITHTSFERTSAGGAVRDDIASQTRITQEAQLLKKINFPGGTIEFIANGSSDPQRCDIYGGKYLKEIIVRNSSQKIIKHIVLQYAYFGSTGEVALSTTCVQGTERNEIRLKLKSVSDITDPLRPLTTTITYNESLHLPNRVSSFARDHWGFYNGKNNLTLVPSVRTVYNGQPYDLSGANRDADSAFTGANQVKKITYPTGGSASYEFEQNDCENIQLPNTYIPRNTSIKGGDIGQSKQILIRTISWTTKLQVQPAYLPAGAVLNIKVYRSIDSSMIGQATYSNAHGNTDSLLPLVIPVAVTDTAGEQFSIVCTYMGDALNATTDFVLANWDDEIYRKKKAAGGLRIKKIQLADPVTGKTISNVYSYLNSTDTTRSSGTMIDLPKYDYMFMYNNASYITRTSLPNNDLGYTQGSPVGYKYVTVKQVDETGGINGATEFEYTTVDDFPEVYHSNGYVNGNAFPFVTASYNNEWRRGNLIRKKIFKGHHKDSLTLIAQTDNVYKYYSGLPTTLGDSFTSHGNSLPAAKAYISYENHTGTPPSSYIYELVSYNIYTGMYSELISSTEKSYDNGIVLTQTTNNQYDSNYLQLRSSYTIDSKGDTSRTHFSYPFDLPATAVRDTMLQRNMIDQVIEQKLYKNATLLSTQRNEYSFFNAGQVKQSSSLSSRFGNTLDTDISYQAYDVYGNLIQYKGRNGVTMSYLWNYNHSLPVAEVANATSGDFAYTSFETHMQGGWNGIDTQYVSAATAIAGRRAYDIGTTTISKTGLLANSSYLVTYWSKSGALTVSGTTGSVKTGISANGWTYYEHRVTGVSTVTVSGSGIIDELRLFPSNAQMITYTYEELTGMTSQSDASGKIVYYEYDQLGRLHLIRDHQQNILKQICYSYTGQESDCAVRYYNETQSQTLQKNDCAPGGTGSMVTYTVPANTYSSFISVADANQLAQNHISANGQAYANANGNCTFYNVAQSGSFQKNNCAPGGTGSTVTYTVAANTYSSTSSQAAANQLAIDDVNANGQTYANANGNCTFYNAAQSGNFQKNNCASGGTGSTVTYTVAVNTYSSTSSQAAANQLAIDDVNANGQAYANANGNCTFYNAAQSGNFQKNNCASGGTGSTVTYTVAANTYSSTSSQAAANQLAIDDVNANGQAYANTNGNCTFYNTVQSGNFQKNNCAPGGTGSTVTYTVAANSYSSTSSQAAANQLAIDDVTANGQAYANTNGNCTFYNTAQSGNFQKNNCAPGGTGSTVTYTVAANTYSSTSSQAAANQLAIDDVTANGQSHANSNGYCTFYNTAQSGNFQKNNCAPGGTGSTVTYTVAANSYSSTSSQAAADQLAINEINANGQSHANTNGYCTFYNTTQSGTFYKNNCAPGGTGSAVTYTVSANSYSSTSSQAAADQLAINEINANGQTHANNTGYCTFYNTAQSGNFQKNNCAPGGTGSIVTYTIPANTYSSTSSQAAADQLAINAVNANGQTHANNTGYCTFYNTAQSGNFQKNNCAPGGTGSTVTYTIPANSYSSTSSQAAADQLAINAVNANGQSYANNNGYCTFYNTVQQTNFQKNNCAPGGTGSTVTYTVPANSYSSTSSQAAADQLAINEINANGQTFANNNGYCTFYNSTQSTTFYKNNCASGGYGSAVTYTVSAGAYSSTSSQAAADQLAINEINANGQAYANSNGYCTFYNTAQSGTFYKNNCAPGGTGSAVVYTISAYAYSSTESQAAANQLAINAVNAGGQTYANNNGYCTFYNAPQSVSYQRNNCSTGGTGSWVTYTVPEGSYSSTSSQSDANQQALNAAHANGQAYANANGTCTYYNTTQQAYFQKNNCPGTAVGSSVLYTVYAGAYSSNIDQAHANQYAINDLNANGQTYANNNGGCTYYSVAYSANFQKSDCGSGGTGSTVLFTVPAGSFTSTTSQGHANGAAYDYMMANGYAYANANGTCTYYNTAQSGTFTRNNCGSGYTGGQVTYTVPANTYSSNTSQSDANQQAINDVNANGQAYANANGSCTAIQTDVYAQLTIENVYDYFDGYSYGDLVVRFYTDASATVPTSANNLNINYTAYDQCAWQTSDTYYGAYGYYAYLYYGATLSYPSGWCGYPCYSPCYINYQLTTGTGYIIIW